MLESISGQHPYQRLELPSFIAGSAHGSSSFCIINLHMGELLQSLLTYFCPLWMSFGGFATSPCHCLLSSWEPTLPQFCKEMQPEYLYLSYPEDHRIWNRRIPQLEKHPQISSNPTPGCTQDSHVICSTLYLVAKNTNPISYNEYKLLSRGGAALTAGTEPRYTKMLMPTWLEKPFRAGFGWPSRA